jgi:hypothetical protein
VARSAVITQPGEISFAISKQEAQSALIEFEQPSGKDSILVKSGLTDAYGNELFMFEVNWRCGMIATVFNARWQLDLIVKCCTSRAVK